MEKLSLSCQPSRSGPADVVFLLYHFKEAIDVFMGMLPHMLLELLRSTGKHLLRDNFQVSFPKASTSSLLILGIDAPLQWLEHDIPQLSLTINGEQLNADFGGWVIEDTLEEARFLVIKEWKRLAAQEGQEQAPPVNIVLNEQDEKHLSHVEKRAPQCNGDVWDKATKMFRRCKNKTWRSSGKCHIHDK